MLAGLWLVRTARLRSVRTEWPGRFWLVATSEPAADGVVPSWLVWACAATAATLGGSPVGGGAPS
jgi:hypothetical protein